MDEFKKTLKQYVKMFGVDFSSYALQGNPDAMHRATRLMQARLDSPSLPPVTDEMIGVTPEGARPAPVAGNRSNIRSKAKRLLNHDQP